MDYDLGKIWQKVIIFNEILDGALKETSDIYFAETVDSHTIVLSTLSKEKLADLYDIDVNCIKQLELENAEYDLFIIDNSKPHAQQLNDKLLNFFNDIGNKYFDGEPISSRIEEDKDYLTEWIMSELMRNGYEDVSVAIMIEDYDVCIAINQYIDKHDFGRIIKLKPEMFTEVSNPFMTVVLCSCPRISLERFFDESEIGETEGLKKWIL